MTSSQKVFVVANNHYCGQGPANALQLRAMLEDGPVDVPESMTAHFPELGKVCRYGGERFRDTLFDV